MTKRLAAALSVIAALTVASVAIAGSLPAAGSGSISFGSIDGTLAAASVQPRYQDRVTFSTTGAGKLKNPRVAVDCYQNDSLVYADTGSPTTTFKLGGDSSPWVTNGGGPASCTAELYYILNARGTGEWNGSGGQGGIVDLADMPFKANS